MGGATNENDNENDDNSAARSALTATPQRCTELQTFLRESQIFLSQLPRRLWQYAIVRTTPPETTGIDAVVAPFAEAPPELQFWMQATGWSALTGGLLGGLVETRVASLRYTVEHAHRKPTTKHGWLFYHRRKNFTVLWAFLRRAVRDAGRFGLVTGGFLAVDTGLDVCRGHGDWWHGIVSGCTIGSVFAFRHGLRGALRRQALVVSGAVGGAYSAVQWLDMRYFQGTRAAKYAPRELSRELPRESPQPSKII